MKPPMKKAGPSTKKREAPAKKPAALPTPGAMHTGEDMQYRARDALHTLKRAHEIQNDPALMAHVQKHAQAEREALKKIARKGRA